MTARFPRRHPIAAGVTSALVVLAAGGGLWLAFRPTATTSSALLRASTTTSTVSRGSIRETVSASGTLAPAHDESLNFQVSGRVTSVRVHAGDHVRKGEVLARVDSASLHASVASARATVAADKARVSDDEDDDATSTQTDADRSALAAARNQLQSARAELADARLTSPISGVVVARNLTVGESVSGSSSNSSNSSSSSLAQSTSTSSSSAAQLEVISTKSWKVNATVDASSVGLLAKGDQAQLTVDGVSSTVYGTVKSVGLTPSSSSDTSSSTEYPVVIDVTGSPKGLLDGESVTADLIYRQLNNVLVVPTDAVHTSSSGGSYVVAVDASGATTDTTVKTGASFGGETQITSGLKSGDKVQVQQFRPVSTSGSSNSGTTGRGGFTFPGGGSGNFPGGFGGGSAGFPGGFGGGSGG